MFRTWCVRLVLLSFCVAPSLAGGLAQGANFDLSIVIQSGTVIDGRTVAGFDDESRSPVINSLGEVLAQIELEGTGHALVTPRRVVATAGSLVGGVPIGALDEEDPSFAINDAGQVVFSFDSFPAGDDERRAVALDDALVATAGTLIGGETLQGVFFTPVAINDSGDVVYGAFIGGSQVLATQDAVLFREGDEIDGLTFSGGPLDALINHAGQVAFSAGALDGGAPRLAIVVDNQVAVKSGDEVAGVTLNDSLRLRALGDDGAIVYSDVTPEGVFRVFRQDELLRTLSAGDVVDGHELVSAPRFPLAANAAGDVAYAAFLQGGVEGIFAGDRLVAKTGDMIEGRTISEFISGPGINERGDLVFWAEFGRDHFGVVTAVVPEGNALGLMAAGLTTLAVCLRRRKNRQAG